MFATPLLSLKPVQHRFHIVGCIVYQGFYRKDRAEAATNRLRRRCDDVWIGGVPAYSTLGYFADPLLSTMDRWSDGEMVGTVFHERTRHKFYVEDDTTISDSFATFVQCEGLRQWHVNNDLRLPGPIKPDDKSRSPIWRPRFASARKRCTQATCPMRETVTQAGEIRAPAQYDLTGLPQLRPLHRYPPNNAKLVPFSLCDLGVPAFVTLFKRCDSNWTRFYAVVCKVDNERPARRVPH